jgi:transaldolase
MPANPLVELNRHGQSVWLDDLSRAMIQDGSLARRIREDALTGITSNPKIFRDAIAAKGVYDSRIEALAARGLSPVAIYEHLAIADVRDASDLFRPAYDRTGGTDGFVSLEVSPHLARDTVGTIAEAERLWNAVDRPNVFIKIPGTAEGVPAIEACLTRGINVNITLLFSLQAYRDVMEAYLRALEARHARGEPLGSVASVASFFLSRIDVKIDRWLDERSAKGGDAATAATALRGRAAIASARVAYSLWKAQFSSDRWRALEAAGAHAQKPLWASTSTKDPAYSDVKYVEALIGPDTVNTMPEETLDAFRDHGRVADTIETDLDDDRQALARLGSVGIDLDRATTELVEEGIQKFVQPFDALLETVEERAKQHTS